MTLLKIMAVSLAISTMLLFSGCSAILEPYSAQGKEFSKFKEPHENHGMVYIYRPSKLIGFPVSYDINVINPKVDDFVAGKLLNAGYIEIELPVGPTEIWAKIDANDFVNFNIKNGKTYCVKGGFAQVGLAARSPDFEVVNISQCRSEIIKTRQIK